MGERDCAEELREKERARVRKRQSGSGREIADCCKEFLE